MGGRFDCKVSGRDTGGDLCIYDTLRDAKGGPALHLHHSQDEWFYIIRGEFIVRVGEDTLSLHPGDSAFAPRKIPHAFAMVSEGRRPDADSFSTGWQYGGFLFADEQTWQGHPQEPGNQLKGTVGTTWNGNRGAAA